MRRNYMKRVLSLALVLVMVFTLLPMSAFANTVASGKCGDNVKWSCNGSTLTISGTGDMWDTDAAHSAYGWSDAVSYWDLTKIVIGEGVTGVGDYAFYEYPYVTSVTLPSTLKSIGDYAFYNTGITSISLPAGLQEIGDGAFSLCNKLSSVALPSSLLELGEYAFSRTAIQSITIPEKVRSIPDSAFASCLSLKKVTLPAGLQEIDECAFAGCGALTSVTIPAGVRSVSASSFQYCLSLTGIWVNSGNSYYTSVDGVLFNKAKTELVAYPGGGKTAYTVPSGTKTIGSGAFTQCEHLTSVTVPAGVTAIGDSAFINCRGLTKVTIADGVKTIGSGAFSGCDALSSVKLPAGLTTISKNLFYMCSALNTVKIPSGVTTIENAFVFSGLKSLDIPASVTRINGINGCNSGEPITVRFYGNAPTMSSNCFQSAKVTAYYPVGNSTWTSSVRGNYGGTVTWKSFKPAPTTAPVITADYLTVSGKPYIKWNAVDSAVKYEVYRSGSKDGTYQYLGYVTDTSYTDTSAKAGYGYYYKVVSINTDYKSSERSNAAFSRCHCAKPVVTADYLTVSGKPNLKWSAVASASGYEIYRSGSKDGTYTKIGTTTSTNYTDTKAGTGYGYYYKVKAICSVTTSGNSYYSDAVFGRCHCPKPVVTPDYLSSSGKPYLKWNAVEKAAKYEIYRAGSKTGTYTKIGTTTATNYTDTTAGTGSGYYYKVKAVSSVSTSANSYYSEIVFARSHCAKPVVTITTSNGHPLVKWSAVTGAASYDVYRSTDGKNFVKYTSTTGTSWTNSSAAAGTLYYYKVIAVSKVTTSANSAYSNIVSIKAANAANVTASTTYSYVLNTNTMKYHRPTCSSANQISAENKATFDGTTTKLKSMGYEPCKICNP